VTRSRRSGLPSRRSIRPGFCRTSPLTYRAVLQPPERGQHVRGQQDKRSGREAVGKGRLRHGDIGYVSLWVGDVERAAGFFSSVLGWRSRESEPGGRQVEGLSLSHGIRGGHPQSTLMLCYAVEDLEAATDRVRAAGGTAEPSRAEPYGRVSDCVDSQGVYLALYEPPRASPKAAGRARQDVVSPVMSPT